MEDRPILRSDIADVWEYFSELICYRQYGMSANPLLISEISVFLDEREVRDPERRRWLITLIKKLDIAWLTHTREQESNG
jgi:hypothetical protein